MSKSSIWTGKSVEEDSQSPTEGRQSSISATSEYGFALDQISLSTIVEKLVSERLKLGIMKSAKGPEICVSKHAVLEVEEESSSDEDIPSLRICLNKFEKEVAESFKDLVMSGEEPLENPPQVIVPHYSSSDESDVDYRDPSKDIHMMLNRTRSFYTPNGFKDSRPDLKRLEGERERIWAQRGRDRYTILLYEEAVKPIKYFRIKGRIGDSQMDEVSRDELITKSLESLMNMFKPKELFPENWDPGLLGKERFPPYWAIASPEVTDKTINIIRHLYKEIKETDFTKMDVKMRRRTGRKLRKESIESEEMEEETPAKVEEVSSEDEPYLLKRKDSAFFQKKKVVEEVVVEEEVHEATIYPGLYNIQEGHEISISTLQKQYPESSESESLTDSEKETEQDIKATEPWHDDASELSYTQRPHTKSTPPSRSSWLGNSDLDESTSDESLFANERWERPPPVTPEKPASAIWRGFPVLTQRPKWITLQRECLEQESESQSQVERYRCLCNSRGIPPFETVARSLKKKSAVFNRMGQGPQSTIQTLSEVLGPQTKLLDLTGYYLNKCDVYYLGLAMERLVHLNKLRLSRTKLTGEMLVTLVHSMSLCENLCLLDLSYNNLRRIKTEVVRLLPYSIKTLCLCHCGLSSDSFNGLAALSPSVRSLDVSWNKLNETAGIKYFANSLLKHQSGLRELRMGWNALEGADVLKVFTELAKNLEDLTYLDLSYNGFGTIEEMNLFNDMLLNTPKLRCLLLAGNSFATGADEALLKDLNWVSPPELRFIDLGDFWIEKPIYQMCKQLKADWNVEVRIGGIKGNVTLSELDMSSTYMRRIRFLNTPKKKKKKKNVKDFGDTVKKLLDAETEGGGGPRVKAFKLRQAVEEDSLKVEEGLIDGLIKCVQDKSRTVDLQRLLDKYREMYPEEIKVEKKKKKPQKKKSVEIEIPEIEILEPIVEPVSSDMNLLFLNKVPKKKQFKI